MERKALATLLENLEKIQSLLIRVSTGQARIQSCEDEYKGLFLTIEAGVESLKEAGIAVEPLNQFRSLWDWHKYWKEHLPTYAERREYVSHRYSELDGALKLVLHRSKEGEEQYALDLLRSKLGQIAPSHIPNKPKPYFSQKELSHSPRTFEELTSKAWRAIVRVINARIEDGSFGRDFPGACNRCIATVGTDFDLMSQSVVRQFPFLQWPVDPDEMPHLYDALDFIQFCHAHVSKPVAGEGYCNSFVRHLAFQDEDGRREFRDVVNGIFARESISFHLEEDGQISRLAPLVLNEALSSAVFNTGDRELDALLESARQKFRSHNPATRKEALEKLWDAWERLKTLEKPKDKKDSIKLLLDKTTSEPTLRLVLEQESIALTSIGNSFMIRHTEVGKTPISNPEQVDYLFHRMFAQIRLLLRSTHRGG